MKTVVVIAHPNLQQSRINRRLMEVTQAKGIQTYNLYDKYPDENIHIVDEQRILESADRIVLQFPFYWYSAPSLLKKWIDSVMTFGWAYGAEGNALRDKPLSIAVSTGGPAEAYSPEGYNKYLIEDLLLPFQAMANLTKMDYQKPFVISGVRTLADEELQIVAEKYVAFIQKQV